MAPRILVAETDALMQTMLKSSLQAAGWEVIQATDGDTAWNLIETATPKLVVLDTSLPGLSSREIVDRLQTRAVIAKPPIVMLGEEIPTQEMVQWFRLGADNYISKPFSNQVVVAQVRSLLRRVHAI